MNRDTLNNAISEAKRFLRAAKSCRNKAETGTVAGGHQWTAYPPKASGACKRASMDLSRALADLRRPG
jgi:hypothetical protein